MTHKLLIGNVVLNPEIIKNFLKKSCYWISFDEKENTMKLCASHLRGGEILFSISNCSYIQAKEFSELLGLKNENGEHYWGKWNPIYELDDDGSEDAEKIKICAFKLGIPLIVRPVSEDKKWAFYHSDRMQKPPDWSVEKIIEQLNEWAVLYKESLSTIP